MSSDYMLDSEHTMEEKIQRQPFIEVLKNFVKSQALINEIDMKIPQNNFKNCHGTQQ